MMDEVGKNGLRIQKENSQLLTVRVLNDQNGKQHGLEAASVFNDHFP